MKVVASVVRIETSADLPHSPRVVMSVDFSGPGAWEEFVAEFGDKWVLPMTVDMYKAKDTK